MCFSLFVFALGRFEPLVLGVFLRFVWGSGLFGFHRFGSSSFSKLFRVPFGSFLGGWYVFETRKYLHVGYCEDFFA